MKRKLAEIESAERIDMLFNMIQMIRTIIIELNSNIKDIEELIDCKE